MYDAGWKQGLHEATRWLALSSRYVGTVVTPEVGSVDVKDYKIVVYRKL